MTDPAKVAEVATGLSPAQRETICRAPMPDLIGAGVFYHLYAAGLVELDDADAPVHTPLGLAVRAHLEGTLR